jgi:hypothetical protein
MSAVEYTKGIDAEKKGYDKFLKEYAKLFQDNFVTSMLRRRNEGKDFTPKMIEVLDRMMNEEWKGYDLERSRMLAIQTILDKMYRPTNPREVEFVESLRKWTPRVTSRQASYLRRVAGNQPENMDIQASLNLLGAIEDGTLGGESPSSHPNCLCTDVPEKDAKAGKGKMPATTSTPRTEVTDDDMRELEEFDKELRRDIDLTGRTRAILGDGVTNDTAALRDIIKKANKKEKNTLYFSAGTYPIGVTTEEFSRALQQMAKCMRPCGRR